MAPMLSLGIPGAGATAVLMGAFTIYGIPARPLLMQTHPELVSGLVNSMCLGNVVLFVLNLPLIFIIVRLLYIPHLPIPSVPLVLALCSEVPLSRRSARP